MELFDGGTDSDATAVVAGGEAPDCKARLTRGRLWWHSAQSTLLPLTPRGQQTLWPPPGGHSFFREGTLQVCYIDEAGDLGELGDPPRPNDQPVLVLGGLFLDVANLPSLTNNFLDLKHRYFPGLAYPSYKFLDRILPEIKGSDIRRNATCGNARQRRHAIGFLDNLLGLLRRNDVRLVARIWVKGIGGRFDGTAVYTSSIQGICEYFEHWLINRNDAGICIADSRNKFKNVNVSHSIFTKKLSAVAPSYQRLIELPTFGHSENHAGLQICDIVCSSLLYPISCYSYCTGHVNNVHVQPRGVDLKNRYGEQLKDLQYRYQNPESQRYEGGIVVSDELEHRSGSLMFR